MTAADAVELARVMGAIFARRDPPAYAVGITPGEFEFFVGLLAPKAAREGLTIIARSAAKEGSPGELLGAMITEATNKTSQHVFRKLGFAERVRRSYAEHRFNGTAHFTAIADHGGPMLMDRAIRQ